jgi:hypothetical protein
VGSKSVPFERGDFFKRLEEVLVRTIGPVAPFVIDDVLLDTNMERDRVEKEIVPLLTEAVSQQIADEDKRLKFQQEMLEYIRRL